MPLATAKPGPDKTIVVKCNRLSTANQELKRQVREFTGELNGLRAAALQHHSCNCPVACYNFNQARTVAVSLQASGTTGIKLQQQQERHNTEEGPSVCGATLVPCQRSQLSQRLTPNGDRD